MAPSSSSPQIIRIPRTDSGEDGSFILGQVTSAGSKPLNVKLVATEGEEPYVVKLKHDRIGDLRVSNSPCSPDEWESILKAILLNGEPVEGIEAGAEAKARESITITVRRRVAGINQRLGTVALTFKEDEEVSLFDWCGAVALEREKFREDLVAETARAADLEARVAELRSQLDELTQAKKAREREILEKMCTLINEKKLKIREQQRLLSTAKVDPTKLAEVTASDSGAKHWAPKASRPGKRKTRDQTAGDDDESSDDGFEKMDVDQPRPATQEDKKGEESDSVAEEHQTSDEHDEDETGSEPEPEEEDGPPIPPPTKTGLRKTTPARTVATRSSPAASRGKGKGKGKETLTIHQRRKVPSPSPGPAAAAAAAAAAEGSETESDDEL
ncbi:hypothetical protein B0H66DRAFT_642421 [Apodospora peruviana]|uniref:Mitotic apparatus protein p62 n=1 Tax=Apodospora peruviana TaxID=516989 RepID=A0AAE0HYJ3_9PEZI|nr:hypothetical protein B0H66DRAFT_642421 [Apodospora peruviana]